MNTSKSILLGLFITAVVASQVTASKLIEVSIPIIGLAVVAPGGTIAYALTYFASDCISELYGEKEALTVVRTGFAMNLVLLGLVWLTIAWPAAPGGLPSDQFAAVLGSATNIVIGGLVAYLISQQLDVYVFHRLRSMTDGAYLWLRNVVSTSASQAVDTAVFTALAFNLVPAVLGIGAVLPWSAILALAVGQYALKLLIAVIDTPFVYLTVNRIRSNEPTN